MTPGTLRLAVLVLLLLASAVGWGCASRAFGPDTEPAPALSPSPQPGVTVAGVWQGMRVWDGGRRRLDVLLDLTPTGNEIHGTATMTGVASGRFLVEGMARRADVQVTLLGEQHDDRYLLAGELSEDGRRLSGYIRGAGVDFELQLRKILRPDEDR